MTNESERVAKRILGGTLAKSGWAFFMKIRLQDVLDLDVREPEWSLYTTGHFDFVVGRSSDDLPVFALEIDGPSHENPKQVSRDIIKSRLCSYAGLPLLRLGIDALDEAAEVSVLEWLVERFVYWQEQSPAYRADGLSPFVHHVVSPFPGNLAATTRLFNDFRISVGVTNSEVLSQVKVFQHHWLVQASRTFANAAPYRLQVEWPAALPTFQDGAVSEFTVSKVEVRLSRRDSPEALFGTTGQARFAWAHKTRSSSAIPPHALILSAEELRALGLFAPDLPWLDASAIADELAIYDALSKVERWAASVGVSA
jgi:uncharacterized protein DUF2726